MRPKPIIDKASADDSAKPKAGADATDAKKGGAKGAKDDAKGAKDDAKGKAAKEPAADTNPIDHDTVILVNEQRFQGTVVSDQPDAEWVAINTGSGMMNIRRESIARVEFGLTARIGRVKPDDLTGLVDLAHWCRANRRNPEALKLLTQAIVLPDCPLAARGLYAQLVDEVQGPEKALPLYIAYRNAGGTDAEILARQEELDRAYKAWEEKMRSAGYNPEASNAAGAPVMASTASSIEEGYEKYTWVGDDPKWANPVKIETTTLFTSEGPRKALKVDYSANPDAPSVDKAAVVLRRPISLRPGCKLTFFALNNSTRDLRIAVALKTGSAWTYFESQTQPLPATDSGKEFTQLTFDLGASSFKSAASGWSHSTRIADLDQVREMQILLHNGRSQGSVSIAGIAFEDGN